MPLFTILRRSAGCVWCGEENDKNPTRRKAPYCSDLFGKDVRTSPIGHLSAGMMKPSGIVPIVKPAAHEGADFLPEYRLPSWQPIPQSAQFPLRPAREKHLTCRQDARACRNDIRSRHIFSLARRACQPGRCLVSGVPAVDRGDDEKDEEVNHKEDIQQGENRLPPCGNRHGHHLRVAADII